MERLIIASENYTEALQAWAKAMTEKIDGLVKDREELLKELKEINGKDKNIKKGKSTRQIRVG